jgi:chaperone required for assembly of F1-ATPase
MVEESEDQRWERLSQDRVDRPLPKKFYTLATVTDELAIALDGRVVKTPLKAKLVLPTRALAEAVAAEWNAQADVINPALMPLTRLANTALDRAGNERAYVAGQVVEFAGSDLVCYRAEAPQRLVALQAESWDPVLVWAKAALGVDFKSAHGILHVAQDAAAIAAVEVHVATLDDFKLTVAHNLTTLTGSALIALMLVAGAISADEGWKAAHVDEDFQIAQWGEDSEATRRRTNRRIDYDASLQFLKLLQRESPRP